MEEKGGNLTFMAIKIFVTSHKGGTGVSSCCFGLACALSSLGFKTLVADGSSFGTGTFLFFDGEFNPVYTLDDYAKGACRAKQILVNLPMTKNACLLSMAGCFDGSVMDRALKELEGLFDYVLCDETSIKLCERALVITEPYVPSLKSADKCISFLRDGGMSNVSVILNKFNGGLVYEGQILPPTEISYLLHCPIVAVIPEDLSMPLGHFKKITSKAFLQAAENLVGNKPLRLSAYWPVGVSGFLKRKLRKIL
jgi:septum site-determining protein MinD